MGRAIGFDSSVFMYAWENNPRYVGAARRILRAMETGRHIGFFSAIGMVELLTGPKRAGRYDLVTRYKELMLGFPHLLIVPVANEIIDIASDLRSSYHLATPDAVHIATSIAHKASVFLTNDKKLLRVREGNVCLLNDFV